MVTDLPAAAQVLKLKGKAQPTLAQLQSLDKVFVSKGVRNYVQKVTRTSNTPSSAWH